MRDQERLIVDERQLRELRKLVANGEGLQLEFKLKVAYPDKVLREMVAFANTAGGTLLVGVDDDGKIQGVKYPEEELLELECEARYCKPALLFDHEVIPLTSKRSILKIVVPVSARRPHRISKSNETPVAYVRVRDMSVKASREMVEIIERSKKKKDTRFQYGEAEQVLMRHLAEHGQITLPEFRKVARLNRFQASRKLILLVLANVLQIVPTEKGDLYLLK